MCHPQAVFNKGSLFYSHCARAVERMEETKSPTLFGVSTKQKHPYRVINVQRGAGGGGVQGVNSNHPHKKLGTSIAT
jgi:hypothetical protein